MSAEQPAPTLKEFYFTFGVQYRHVLHPVFPSAQLTDGYITVEAPSENQARGMMWGLCGNRWAFVYPTPPSPVFQPLGELGRISWQGLITPTEPTE